MAATDNSNTALTALMSAAMALPAFAGSAAARAPVTEVQLDYRFSAYQEAPLPASRSATGTSVDRYEVESHLLDIRAPLPITNADLSVSLQHETMTGATPWYVMPDADGEPVQIMSGASLIHEQRNDLLTKLNFLGSDSRISVSAGYSEENDYESINAGLEGSLGLNQGLTTLEAGIGYNDNTIEPIDAQKFQRANEYHSDSVTMFVGFSQVLNRRTTFQTSVSLTEASGFLSDPYKWVYVNNTLKPDSRPRRRRKGTLLVRLRRFVSSLKAALHLDYRYYSDDWGIRAHTLTISWYQSLPGGWQISPTLRYYSQSQANFYAPYFAEVPENFLYSSDYRLSPFGAVSGRIRIHKRFGALMLGLSYQVYESDAALALGQVSVANPGLVDFESYGATIQYRFGQ